MIWLWLNVCRFGNLWLPLNAICFWTSLVLVSATDFRASCLCRAWSQEILFCFLTLSFSWLSHSVALHFRCLKQWGNLIQSNLPFSLCQIQLRMVCSFKPCQISVFFTLLDFVADSPAFVFMNGIAECTAEDAFKRAGEHIIFGSGSPFENVDLGRFVLKMSFWYGFRNLQFRKRWS